MPPPRTFSQEEVQQHQSAGDAWVVYRGGVYDVTAFLPHHPGEGQRILDYINSDSDADVTDVMMHWKHSDNAYRVLNQYRVGTLDGASTLRTASPPPPLVNMDRPIVPQILDLHGSAYDDWVHQPQILAKRLQFWSDDDPWGRALNAVSTSPWWVVPLVWVPIVLFYLYFTEGVCGTTVYVVWGVLLWSALEYGIHRLLFHRITELQQPLLNQLHFVVHGNHHLCPDDPLRLVFPPVPAFAAFLVLAVPLLRLLISVDTHRYAATAGLLMGYMFYDLGHYFLHHGTLDQVPYARHMKRTHMVHHWREPNAHFGITNDWLDRAFRTQLPWPWRAGGREKKQE